jgi:hypothetical protein
MNTLNVEEKVRVIAAMVEGNSIRSTECVTGVHRDTIMRLILRVGQNCECLLDERMRGLPCLFFHLLPGLFHQLPQCYSPA